METTVRNETEGNIQELSSAGSSISVKNEKEIKVEPSYQLLPSDDFELKPIVIEHENHEAGAVANFYQSADLIAKVRKQTSLTVNTADRNQFPKVMLETIPKTEAEIVRDDKPPSSSTEDHDLFNMDMNSDSNSNSDPEIDPFADINCDPSFFPIRKSHNSDGSGTSTISHIDVSGRANQLSSEKTIVLIVSATNTSKQRRCQRQKLSSKLQCGLCLEMQSSDSKLQTHVKICAACHQNRHRYCVPCNTLFSTRQKYRQHALTRHGIQVATSRKSPSFHCMFCPTVFAARESLAAHLTSHPEIQTTDKESLHLKPYECQDCSSTFRHYSVLSIHMKSHKDEREFKCPEPNCEKAFKTNANLKEHLKRVHSEVRPFKCGDPNCGKTFKVADQLRKHMVCHSEDRPFGCGLLDCGKMFKNKERLAKHLKAHNGTRRYSHITERPFKCEQCDRGFCKNWELNKHLGTHSKKETYFLKCPQPNCKTTFKYKQNIKVHIANIHTNKDVLPFQCPEPGCVQRFKYKRTLQTHVSTHTEQERPFKCPQPGCSASFNRSTYLNSHLKQKHK